jgi:hypothetical protein
MKVAKARGRLRGKQPELSPLQEAYLVQLQRGGQQTSADLRALRSRPLERHRALQRACANAPAPKAA